MDYDREVLLMDKMSTKTEREELFVNIKPGYSQNTVLTFENKGNERYANHCSRLIVKFKQVPHEIYERKGNDLYYTQILTLE